MDATLGARLKKTAGEVAGRLGEAALNASERINELVEMQHITQQIHALQREKAHCRQVMADLLIRMFDQETFAEALLRPEYNRIKEIECEISRLEQEKDGDIRQAGDGQADMAAPSAELHDAKDNLPTGEVW